MSLVLTPALICRPFVHMLDMEIYRRLGLAAAARRRALGRTQAEIAAQVGLTRASLANIETGRQKVMLHHVYRLASALGLDSILDLVPPTFAFTEPADPVTFTGSAVNDREKAQLEHFIRSAGKRQPWPTRAGPATKRLNSSLNMPPPPRPS